MPGPPSRLSRSRPEARPWYERDDGARLAFDRRLVAEHYPELSFRVDHETRRVELEGLIRLVADCGIATPIGVRLIFPDDYPEAEPRAFDAGDRFPHDADHHFFADGQCCLWLDLDSEWDKDDPDGLLRFLDQLSLFFDRQLTYEATGIWPGGERPHGWDSATVDLVLDLLDGDGQLLDALTPAFANRSPTGRNSSCPCGSTRKYKRCHLETVELMSRRVGVDRLRRAFQRRVSRSLHQAELGRGTPADRAK